MKFLRHLLGITKLDQEMNQSTGTNWMCTTQFGKYKNINKSGYSNYRKWIKQDTHAGAAV